eukprot:TRINITY_DN25961_c0_g1_i1.p1 TRINITY_DN25961_c0_g1~~TRINITY_DN25961_c0_g1_i1.p1  ORF type:complete len:330 (+),score=64.69 TRINITY_DN25961_c0_g1_i1:151-1140(+)
MDCPLRNLISRNETQDIHCNAWNHNGERMAGGSSDGFIYIFDAEKGRTSPQLSRTSSFKAHSSSVFKIVWAPPEYGDVIASCAVDATISLWEEVEDEDNSYKWQACYQFPCTKASILDIQFGDCQSGLKFIQALSDGHVRVYESLQSLELKEWQLQAEFLNITDEMDRFIKCSCTSASIAWKSHGSSFQEPTFILGFNSNIPQINIPKMWKFEEVHQRWEAVAELTVADEVGDTVTAISWAHNIGRPYELIAIATTKGISIWHVEFQPNAKESPVVNRVALIGGEGIEIWQLDWDMSGMALASSGRDGVRVWQFNLKGIWKEVVFIESA